MMSWPSIATGRVIAWIGNGATMPTELSASMMRGPVPRSAQLIAGTAAGAGAAGSGAMAGSESVNGSESVAGSESGNGAADAGSGTDSTAVDAVSVGEPPEIASSSGASLAGEADTRCLT